MRMTHPRPPEPTSSGSTRFLRGHLKAHVTRTRSINPVLNLPIAQISGGWHSARQLRRQRLATPVQYCVSCHFDWILIRHGVADRTTHSWRGLKWCHVSRCVPRVNTRPMKMGARSEARGVITRARGFAVVSEGGREGGREGRME